MVVWQSKDGLTPVLRLLAVVTLLGLAVAHSRTADDPNVPLLHDSGRGIWLTADTEVDLSASFKPLTTWRFRRRFTIERPQPESTLSLRMLRFGTVTIGDRPVLTTTEAESDWQQIHQITIPDLKAGEHVLSVEVTNRNGPPCLWTDGEDPHLVADTKWEVSTDGDGTWIGTRAARETRWSALSERFPTVRQSLQQTGLWFALIFAAVSAFTWRRTDPLSPVPESSCAGRVRTVLIIAVGMLGLHNLGALQPHIGYDVLGHLDYVKFLEENGRIPLASDGWQMFQSPLYYLLNLPAYWLLADRLEPEAVVRALRLIPLVCGLLQIEMAYRMSRVVFPDRAALQCVAVVVGGMMPMSISMSQSLGNEPLAGLLTSITLLRFLSLLKSDKVIRGDVIMLGIVWGLAMLTKVTPVLLGPVLLLGVLIRSLQAGVSIRSALGYGLVFLMTAFVVCGWYYLRNWSLMGQAVRRRLGPVSRDRLVAIPRVPDDQPPHELRSGAEPTDLRRSARAVGRTLFHNLRGRLSERSGRLQVPPDVERTVPGRWRCLGGTPDPARRRGADSRAVCAGWGGIRPYGSCRRCRCTGHLLGRRLLSLCADPDLRGRQGVVPARAAALSRIARRSGGGADRPITSRVRSPCRPAGLLGCGNAHRVLRLSG